MILVNIKRLTPVFVGLISAYVVANYLYWRFFLRQDQASSAGELASGSVVAG